MTVLREGPVLEAYIAACLDRQLCERGKIPAVGRAAEALEPERERNPRELTDEQRHLAKVYPSDVIMLGIAEAHGVSAESLLRVQKGPRGAAARQHAMTVFKTLRLMTHADVGELFGISIGGCEDALRRWKERQHNHVAAQVYFREYLAKHTGTRT
jgi:hypothetical protein